MRSIPNQHDASKQGAPSVCLPVPLRSMPNDDSSQLSLTPLPWNVSQDQLFADFKNAPQFSGIDFNRLIRLQPQQFRLIFIAKEKYYARQCAFYLTAMRIAQTAYGADRSLFDDLWVEDTKPQHRRKDEEILRHSLLVYAPTAENADPNNGSSVAIRTMNRHRHNRAYLTDYHSPSVLISTEQGAGFSADVMEEIDSLCREQRQVDIFISTTEAQLDMDTIEELRFSKGFIVCETGVPTQAYLRQVLVNAAALYGASIEPAADLDTITASIRRYRGHRYEEHDIQRNVERAIQAGAPLPLREEDLIPRPFHIHRDSWQELDGMTGLKAVKEGLRRLLAAVVLENHLQQNGLPSLPIHRNLAFSGPPGTGKSVTARLVAQILREESVGSGRFVEVGREQLIGQYLGETSAKIAQVFREAQGGVLFIDEAGALVTPDGRDIYATEAVNALVRHMELSPETMVILATYPEEMKKLLSSNPGLSSRVAQVLDFPGYTLEELWEILCYIGKKSSMEMPGDSKETCMRFFDELRNRKQENFGNGREARRLFHCVREEAGLRFLKDRHNTPLITTSDVVNATEFLLLQEEAPQATRTIGFAMNSEDGV